MGLAARRATAGAVTGVAVLAGVLLAGATWSVAALAAWDAAALVVLIRVWSKVARLDAQGTAQLARSEDDSRTAAEALLLSAGVASLIAVAFTLVQAGHADELRRVTLTALAVASVLLSWVMVHSLYTLRYARLYYAPPFGGIDFHEADPPDYRDLLYVALTVGMTFQVSDTDIKKRQIRRAAIHHSLLSYVFGTVILAITVSTVAALLWKR